MSNSKTAYGILALLLVLTGQSWGAQWSDLAPRDLPFKELGTEYSKALPVQPVEGEVILVNVPLLKSLGLLDPLASNDVSPELSKKLLEHFSIEIDHSKNSAGANDPIATFYQDGGIGYNSGTGDGRVLILNHVVDSNAQTFDISAKGIGATGLGYKNYPGHTDGLDSLADGIQEYLTGELFHRAGISNSSRVLAVIKTNKLRTLSDGSHVPASIVVRVMPTFLRMAHLWLQKDSPAGAKRLLETFFKSDSRFFGDTSFSAKVHRLMRMNIETSARELAILDALAITHASPTRGNRLLTGELIDFGTVFVMGQNYREFSANPSLGRTKQQKDFALRWTEKVYNILRTVDPTLEASVRADFDRTYKTAYAKTQLMKAGVSETWADRLLLEKPNVATRFGDSLAALEKIESRKNLQADIRMPIVDSNKLLSHLDWQRVANSQQAYTIDAKAFVQTFGTPFASANFNTAQLVRSIENFNTALATVVDSLVAITGESPAALARALNKNVGYLTAIDRDRGLGARQKRMQKWESQIIGQNLKGAPLLQTLNEDLDRMNRVVFHDKFSPTSETLEGGELYQRYQLRNAPNERSRISRKLPDWFSSLVADHDSPALKGILTEHVRDGVISEAGLAKLREFFIRAYDQSFHATTVKSGLSAKATGDSQFFSTLFNVLTMFPNDINWRADFEVAVVTPQETIRQEDLSIANRHLTLELKASGTWVSIVIKDEKRRVVFTDGPRSIYTQESSGKKTLSSSYTETVTDPSLRNAGLYQRAIQTYARVFPEIERFYLQSENRETLDFYLALKSALNKPNLRAKVLNDSDLATFTKSISRSMGHPIDSLSALTLLSLQGRTRLKSGLSFEKAGDRFGLFSSERLTDRQSRQMLSAIEALEASLKSRGDYFFMRELFGAPYADFIRSATAPRAAITCSALFVAI